MNQRTVMTLLVSTLVVLGVIWYFYSRYGGMNNNTSGIPTVTETPGPNTVFMDNFTFVPNTMTVSVGTTITWVNKESSVHDVQSSQFTSPSMRLNETYTFTFTQPGTYDYSCGFHPAMTGKIVVQ